MKPRMRFNEDVSWFSYLTTLATCNWVIVGWHCRRKGHNWREQRPDRNVTITSCAYCGLYRGASVTGLDSRWYRGQRA